MSFQSTKSILFNGSTQYATGGNILDFERNQAFSIVGWFKSTTSASANLVAKEGDGSPSTPEGWGIELKGNDSGQLRFVMVYTWVTDCISIDTVAGGFNDGEWHHFALVFDGVTYPSSSSAVSFYVDGSLETLASPLYDNLVSNVSNSYDFTVARRVNTSSPQWYAGALDEVAVYNKVLSAAEVEWIYNAGWSNDLQHANAPSNLVSWWQMGENVVGSTVPDQQGANNISLANSPTVQDDAPVGDAYESQYVPESALDLYLFDAVAPYDSQFVSSGEVGLSNFDINFEAGPAVFYKMRAVDSDPPSPPNPPRYITWVVQGDPDFAGVHYPDGEPTPNDIMVSGSAVVVATWQE